MTAAAPRSLALDALRGGAVALMILVNNPGSWQHLFAPLAHAPWHGCTPTDLVFPFFLFAVGASLAFTLPAMGAAFWAKVGQRAALIFAIGLFLNASPFVRWNAEGELVLRSVESLRIMGVLQRIALAYFCAAVIVRGFGARGALRVAAALLLGYWAACVAFGGADPYSLEGFFGTALDRALLGPSHLYQGEGVAFDPEGLASTVPAVAQVLLGHAAGRLIARRAPDAALVARLFSWACVLLLLGFAWQWWMPLNKKLWTSSYVLHTTGLAMMLLAAFIHLIDIRKHPPELAGWATFFEVFGKNPLFVFVLSGFVPRVLALLRWQDGTGAEGQPLWTSPLPWVYKTLFAPVGQWAGDPRLGSFLFAVANLCLYALLAWWLDRRRIYIRV